MRAMNAGYIEHDHTTTWQECDTCGLRTGEGLTTDWDAEYYSGDPGVCPSCAFDGIIGRMGLPVERRVNARGMTLLHDWLEQHRKAFRYHVDDIYAWAAHAEESQDMTIELPAHKTESGYVEQFTIPAEGFDTVVLR